MYAAQQLQSMLKKSGLNLYIVSRLDEQPQSGSIYVGDCPYIYTDDLHNCGYACSAMATGLFLADKAKMVRCMPSMTSLNATAAFDYIHPML